MGSGYQGLHARPKRGDQRRRVVAGAVVMFIVLVAAWVVARHGGSQSGSLPNDQAVSAEATTVPADSSTSGDSTSVAADSTTAASEGPIPTGPIAGAPPGTPTARSLKPAVPASASRPVPTTAASTTGVASTTARGRFAPPTATWTTYSCAGTGQAWNVTYQVRFSGGSGWTAPGGGTTSTEHMTLATSAKAAPPSVGINHAQVYDTVNHLTRTVALSNPITIHC